MYVVICLFMYFLFTYLFIFGLGHASAIILFIYLFFFFICIYISLFRAFPYAFFPPVDVVFIFFVYMKSVWLPKGAW